ncbi:MAG: hypothetical protein IT449_15265 [Phycisphaerales bacterium]|nr:hypothetical protein [Phycisphaerales bacterium]
MLAPVNRNPDARTLRQFGWIMLGGFAFLALLMWRIKVPVEARWQWIGARAQWGCLGLLLLGAGMFALSRISPPATRRLYVGWMTASRPLGVAMFVLGLSLMFFLALPLFALIVRFNDPMRRRLYAEATYWEPVKPCPPTLERMARPF